MTKYYATRKIGTNQFHTSLSDIVVRSTEPDYYYETGCIEQQGRQIANTAETLGRLIELLVEKDVIGIAEFEDIVSVPYQFIIHEGEAP